MVENKKPSKVYKLGALSISMWENEFGDKKLHSFTFQRAYKDSQDNWQHTQNLRVNDIPKFRILLNEAYKDQFTN